MVRRRRFTPNTDSFSSAVQGKFADWARTLGETAAFTLRLNFFQLFSIPWHPNISKFSINMLILYFVNQVEMFSLVLVVLYCNIRGKNPKERQNKIWFVGTSGGRWWRKKKHFLERVLLNLYVLHRYISAPIKSYRYSGLTKRWCAMEPLHT